MYKVAIIKDDPPTSRQIRDRVLSATPDIEVGQWFTRDDAEHAIAREDYDLVILDIELGRDRHAGVAIINAINKHGRGTPVLAVSAMPAAIYRGIMKALDAWDYLQKTTFEEAEFIDTFLEMLRAARSRRLTAERRQPENEELSIDPLHRGAPFWHGSQEAHQHPARSLPRTRSAVRPPSRTCPCAASAGTGRAGKPEKTLSKHAKRENEMSLDDPFIPHADRPCPRRETFMKRLRNWRKTTKYLLAGFLVFVIAIFLNNTSLLVERGAGSPTLLAHRGIAQQFHRENLRNDTCTAARMAAPTHAYLENTIDSMRASFEAGADILEFDIHPTTDGRFAVFHDWTLECRTDGRGVTREHSMAALKRLDIGYSYTADGGKTFPFRGKGIGLMPALDEVFTTFPEQRFLINIKSNDPAEGRMLAAALRESPPSKLARLMVYGGDRPVAILRQEMQGIRTMSKKTLRDCLFGYVGYGWTGIVPTACAGSVIFVPINIAPWLWGWPDRFLQRMTDAGSEVYVIGPYTGGDFSTGIDSPEDLRRLPQGFAGGIMTNEIETIAPLLRKIR